MLTVRARIYFPYLRAASFTCAASSRVGVSTKMRGPRLFDACGVANKLSAGKVNAAVLPVPVWALAIMSRPFKAEGIACACTAVGLV